MQVAQPRDFCYGLLRRRYFLEEFFHQLLVVVAITSMVKASHVIIAKLSGVIKNEVVGNILDGGFGEIGLIHHGSVRHLFTPPVFLEGCESSFFGASLTVGSNEVKGFFLKRFGQTDHPWSELTTAHSSTPNNE